MLAKFTRGTVLAILAWLIVSYVFTAGKSEPPPPSDQPIGYMFT